MFIRTKRQRDDGATIVPFNEVAKTGEGLDDDVSSLRPAGLEQGAPMILQPSDGNVLTDNYLASTLETIRWGTLPNRNAKPVLSLAADDLVTIDTVSHEGILEDQGRDPVSYFGTHGVAPDDVLADAREIAASSIEHEFDDGPHVVTGPIEVQGARVGDVLRVEVLDLRTRVPYGVISNRHGYGALPGELPAGPGPEPGASPAAPELYHSVCRFVGVAEHRGRLVGTLPYGDDRTARFPLAPFMGIMGVAPDDEGTIHSVPPGRHGGNIDVNVLEAGSTLYLPVQVPGALFYVGDPHYAQGDGEVALTALEAPLRGVFRLSVIPGAEAAPLVGAMQNPVAETDEAWVPMGMDLDLDEAMKDAVRHALSFLEHTQGMDAATALAYLSAAADFEVSQVVDGVKGVHCVIRKADFRPW